MVRDTLQQIADLLERHNALTNGLAIALSGDDARLWDFLISNDLWGGAGSIADAALFDWDGTIAAERPKFESLMIALGREQMRLGKINPRTTMWVEAFERWRDQPEGRS